MGIDPSYNHTAYAVLQISPDSGHFDILSADTIDSDPNKDIPANVINTTSYLTSIVSSMEIDHIFMEVPTMSVYSGGSLQTHCSRAQSMFRVFWQIGAIQNTLTALRKKVTLIHPVDWEPHVKKSIKKIASTNGKSIDIKALSIAAANIIHGHSASAPSFFPLSSGKYEHIADALNIAWVRFHLAIEHVYSMDIGDMYVSR